MVFCVDEKTQFQLLDRIRPLLPKGLGYVEGVTHDYSATALPPCLQRWM